jgi:predicted PurR-regulated permease PerM
MAKNEYDDLVKLARVVLWMGLIVGTIFILKYFGNLLKPLLMAFIMWYLIRILRNLIQRVRPFGWRIPRWLGNLISLGLIFSALYAIIDILVVNIQQIVLQIEQYDTRQDSLIKEITGFLGMENFSQDIAKLPGSKELRPFLTGLVNSLTSALGNVVVIIIYLIFILIEEIVFSKKIDIISKKNKAMKDMKELTARMNHSIKSYISVKTFASFLTAFLAYWILFFYGVDFPMLWAFLIFLLNFIPYVGSFVATLLPSLFAALQFQSFMDLVWVFVMVQLAQTIVASFIEPKIVGKSLKLSPFVVLVTPAVWGTIWGILGMVISVPITSILVIVLAQFPETQNIAIILSESGNIEDLVVSQKDIESSEEEKAFWKNFNIRDFLNK